MTSYELAIWDGERPDNDVVALVTYLDLYDQYIDTEDLTPPSQRISTFVQALMTQWPDIDDTGDSPWTGKPFEETTSGPIVYVTIVYSRAKDVMSFIAPLATHNGLVCFDVQQECLLLQ